MTRPGAPFVLLNNPAPGSDCDALLPIAVKPDECVRLPVGEAAFSAPVGCGRVPRLLRLGPFGPKTGATGFGEPPDKERLVFRRFPALDVGKLGKLPPMAGVGSNWPTDAVAAPPGTEFVRASAAGAGLAGAGTLAAPAAGAG